MKKVNLGRKVALRGQKFIKKVNLSRKVALRGQKFIKKVNLGRKVALRGKKIMKKLNFGPKSRPRYSHAVVVPFRSPQASLLNQRQNARRHVFADLSTDVFTSAYIARKCSASEIPDFEILNLSATSAARTSKSGIKGK